MAIKSALVAVKILMQLVLLSFVSSGEVAAICMKNLSNYNQKSNHHQQREQEQEQQHQKAKTQQQTDKDVVWCIAQQLMPIDAIANFRAHKLSPCAPSIHAQLYGVRLWSVRFVLKHNTTGCRVLRPNLKLNILLPSRAFENMKGPQKARDRELHSWIVPI